MKALVVTLALILTGLTYAQKERTLKFNDNQNLIEAVYYHDNGEISQTGSYNTDGKLHGKWISYSENGDKLMEGHYDNGRKVGIWLFWSNGEVKEVNYTDNEISSVQYLKEDNGIIAASN